MTRALLLRTRVATLDELKQALGTSVDVAVFRKLKTLDCLASYSRRGRCRTLREIALFDDHGLWSRVEVWFSRFGTLLAAAEGFASRSPRGCFADELAPVLHGEVQDALRQLARQRRVARQIVSGRHLYAALDPTVQRRQLLARRTVEFLPAVLDASVLDASVLEVSPEEAKKPLSSCSTACWTSSSAACMPDWSRSNSVGVAIANWLISSASIRTPLPVDDNSRYLRTWKWTAHAKPALGASGWKKRPEIIDAIEILLEHDTAGDPIAGWKWTRKTTEKIAEVLQQIDIPVSANTVARLL